MVLAVGSGAAVPFWKAAGMMYISYSNICVNLVRNCLKEPFKSEALTHEKCLVTIAVSLALCIFLNDEVQMPWWGLLFAAAMAFIFTLPISIITATTNQTPGLNIITEYVMGVILPGRPIAKVCFKTYGYMSMAQALLPE